MRSEPQRQCIISERCNNQLIPERLNWDVIDDIAEEEYVGRIVFVEKTQLTGDDVVGGIDERTLVEGHDTMEDDEISLVVFQVTRDVGEATLTKELAVLDEGIPLLVFKAIRSVSEVLTKELAVLDDEVILIVFQVT